MERYVIQNSDTGQFYSKAGSFSDWVSDESQAAVYYKDDAQSEAKYQQTVEGINCYTLPTDYWPTTDYVMATKAPRI